MNPKRLLLVIFFLVILPSAFAETLSLVPGEQYNFTAGGSQHAIELISIVNGSATFVVSGIWVSPAVNESKVLNFTSRGTGDVIIILNALMPNSSVSITLDYNASGEPVCVPIDEKCALDSECCVGKCITGVCNYPPTPAPSVIQNVNLDAPENVTTGSIVTFRLSGENDTPVAYAILDVITPSARLTLTTNESGEGSYLAAQDGNYSYETYGYTFASNITTISSIPQVPSPNPLNNTNVTNSTNASTNQTPPQNTSKPLCSGVCSNGGNCLTCPQDCGACHMQQPSGAAQNNTGYSSLLWIGLMLLTIMIILRVVLPIFVRE